MALAVAFQRFAGDSFTLATRIDIGGIEKINAGINRPVNNCIRIFRARLAAEHHTAQTQRTDVGAGTAKETVFHVYSSL
ncbi:MAG: hypothetical protein R2932_58140 [Caldilineaceae bacterium]